LDNGIGRNKSRIINQNRPDNHRSFASEAGKTRLQLLNFDREQQIGIEIIDLMENNQSKGTKVVLKIPLLKH